jgi:hypothetical protein
MEHLDKILESTLASLEQQMKGCASSMPESDELREPAKLTEAKVHEAFKSFETPDPIRSQMLQEARRFVFAMGSASHPAYWLSLVGSSGTGKTLLARMISGCFLRNIEGLRDENRGVPGDRYSRMGGFISWPVCVERMLEGDYGFTRQCKEDWFLALDDVGAENEKLRELGTSKLFSILNERQHKFTVLTCNYGLSEIAQRMDPRIASRLIRHGGVVMDATGVPDFNL